MSIGYELRGEMAALRISLFGPMHVLCGVESSEITLTHSIQVLLSYLLLKRGKLVSRDELVDLFWGDCERRKARNCLNTALWRMRCKFRVNRTCETEFLINNSAGDVGVRSGEGYWLDVAEFEQAWRRIQKGPPTLGPSAADDLQQIALLYRGELLEGSYDDWVIPQREHYRLIYLNSLSRLMEYYRDRRDYAKSLEYGQDILAGDPLREDIHREIMWLHLCLGQRALAIRQYRVCCRILAKELNIGPMSETQDLYEMILSSPGPAVPLRPPIVPRPPFPHDLSQDALQRVKMAVDSLEQARSSLDQAMWALDQGR